MVTTIANGVNVLHRRSAVIIDDDAIVTMDASDFSQFYIWNNTNTDNDEICGNLGLFSSVILAQYAVDFVFTCEAANR